MSTVAIRRAYWSAFAIGFVLASTIGSLAQPGTPATTPSARDLNLTLAELTRVAPATIQDLDIANQQHGGKLHRVTFWRGNKSYDTQTVEALRRNLQSAVPNLIHDTQASGGNISTTFRLYKDLTVVCASLRSLLPPDSNKTEFAALNTDLSDMNRVREELSSYIERSAALMESSNPQTLKSAGRPVKRVIIDDDMPSSKKHRSANQ